jgi:hypothetical protein
MRLQISGALRLAGIVAAVFLVLAQFAGPEKHNGKIDPAQTIEAQTQMPDKIAGILNAACADCHSEKTQWRWYASIAPFSWLQTADVYAGRVNMDLSQWGQFTTARKADRLKGMCKLVQDGEMPLWYYKPLHPGSWLSADDKKQLCDWTNSELAKTPSSP